MNTDECNATLTGNYLWSNVNFGEAVTEPMTPLAWSVLQFTLDDWIFLRGFPTVGNIGGRPYLNISVLATILHAMRRDRQAMMQSLEGTLYMRLPESIEIPLIPLSGREWLSSLPCLAQIRRNQRRGLRQLPSYLAETPFWFQQMRARLRAAEHSAALLALWRDAIRPHIKQGVWCVLGIATHSADYTIQLRRDLNRLVGPEDANLLIANVSAQGQLLASLGPLAGLEKAARGEMSPQSYLEAYSHRGPHEFEISIPRPAEDPQWLDRELANLRATPLDVDALLAEQQTAFAAALQRLEGRSPRAAKSIRRRIAESASRARLRELARSEYTRDRWLVRLFAVRAGQLTGIGDEIFFLTLDEVFALLGGEKPALNVISARQEAYRRYKALPVYPSIILGQFDLFTWAADPRRQRVIFDGQAASTPLRSSLITDSPGSAGRAEGLVRVLLDPQEGSSLQPGEILVAVQTDISWTLLFPRAAAVVTDVGAPLSHAAIVARELGIPAVVGCGDATMRLKTGDRVRVDGSAGTVTLAD